VPHALYGHVPFEAEYSVGDWLRALAPLLQADQRPIIVGGTGLYFRALTEGLAEIPPIPPEIRAEAEALPAEDLLSWLRAHDPETVARIDTQNPARLRRAWEVLCGTGRPISAWQAETGAALLPLDAAYPSCSTPSATGSMIASSAVSTRCWRKAHWKKFAPTCPAGTGRAARARPSARRNW
jgi:tRNA dimethylallyltransferase